MRARRGTLKASRKPNAQPPPRARRESSRKPFFFFLARRRVFFLFSVVLPVVPVVSRLAARFVALCESGERAFAVHRDAHPQHAALVDVVRARARDASDVD